jgi:2',3'-cyclic-nucleotide 2'-phosphodiesterase (5'-nucleotidase family)
MRNRPYPPRGASATRLANVLLSLVAISLLDVCAFRSVAATPASRGRDTLVILHTNDMHAQLAPDRDGKGGMAHVAAYIKRVKSERPDVLALDAGDMVQGGPVSTIFSGAPIFEVLNHAGYDAAALGNHEFDYGLDSLAEFRRIATFPLLSCDIKRGEEYVADAPTALLDVDGVRVGVVGVTTHRFIAGKGLTLLPIAETVREHVEALEPESDVIVVLSHIGKTLDTQLAGLVDGIDVIVGGHSHSRLDEPLRVGDTLIVQAGAGTRHVGRLELLVDLDTEEILDFTGRLAPIPQPDLEPDPEGRAAVDRWEAKVSETVDLKIGSNPKNLRKGEIITRLLAIWREAFATDFAAVSKGSVRGNLSAGDIQVRDIYELLPFQNTIFILSLTRAQAAEFVEDAAFPSDKPLYTVAANSFHARQMIKELSLPQDRVEKTGVNWRDPVIESIRERGSLGSASPTPAVER